MKIEVPRYKDTGLIEPNCILPLRVKNRAVGITRNTLSDPQAPNGPEASFLKAVPIFKLM